MTLVCTLPTCASWPFSQHSVYLKQSYVNQLCTPTRSAMMTGHYPFKTGTQHGVFLNMEAGGVPYYGPQEGYFNHSTDLFDRNSGRVVRGLDFFRETKGQMHPITDKNGVYSTHVFTDETLRVLDAHPRTHPFFLLLSYQSVHAPLQAPASYRSRLKKAGLYENTVIVFSSDNGGDTQFGASNHPLRGEKNTIWEGGNEDGFFRLFHVVDWNPTLLGVAGSSEMLYGDGINQWPSIAEKGTRRLRRTQFIYNIDTPASGQSAAATSS
ncbi:Sulfatase domain containing protein [Aphelenchoides fujianensis]|nr:Sulfatase domain containing protein [Aphelenchoides fujianensis]